MTQLEDLLQPIKIGAHVVPGIWRYMLPEDVLYFRTDPEKRSSCFDCPQVKAHGFHPNIRCCTYIPRVPNFLLGLALMDPGTRPVAESFMDEGYCIPEGSQVSPRQLERSLEFLSGQIPTGSVVCPMLDQVSKRCQIYAFRSGVCSTFFCRHDQGAAGAEFWTQMGDLVTQVETALAQWSLEQSGFDLGDYFARFEALATELPNCTSSATSNWSEDARRQLFGAWFGREKELFENCAALVLKHKNELFKIAGQQRLRQTPRYDAANRQLLEQRFTPSLVNESLPEGEPMPISQIWYGLQLAHRNLQVNRFGSSPTESPD